jgi:DNA-binding response OmpR family regulator
MAASPAERAIVLEPVSSSASADLSPRRRTRRFRPRVLLVEPEPELRSELSRGLVGAGFEVVAAPAIEAVLSELEVEPQRMPNLIVAPVEIAHPDDMDGLTLCEHLRASPSTEHIPVFLLAHHESPEDRDRAAGVGADDYLLQPLPVQDLVTLARLKAGRRAFAPAYEAHTARMPLAVMVRALLAGSRSGRVELRDNEGWLAFRHGHVVDASFGGESGLTALRRLLFFGSGAYAVSFADELAQGEPLIDADTYCAQLVPAAERFTALCTLGIPLSARLTVDFKRLADVLRSLPDDVGCAIRLCDGQRTVYSTLLECHLSEVVTLEAITLLYALGVLVPANVIAEREPTPHHVPPFFEPELEEPFSAAFAASAAH